MVEDASEAEDVASSLSHDELLEVTKSSICTLISCDPLLSDLPTDIILEEVLAQVLTFNYRLVFSIGARFIETAVQSVHLIYQLPRLYYRVVVNS